jgi:hypothetical protein
MARPTVIGNPTRVVTPSALKTYVAPDHTTIREATIGSGAALGLSGGIYSAIRMFGWRNVRGLAIGAGVGAVSGALLGAVGGHMLFERGKHQIGTISGTRIDHHRVADGTYIGRCTGEWEVTRAPVNGGASERYRETYEYDCQRTRYRDEEDWNDSATELYLGKKSGKTYSTLESLIASVDKEDEGGLIVRVKGGYQLRDWSYNSHEVELNGILHLTDGAVVASLGRSSGVLWRTFTGPEISSREAEILRTQTRFNGFDGDVDPVRND